MAENTLISWAHCTFNPWMGCTKVSPACANCYAERDMDHRYGKVKWGPQGNRVLTSDANWKKPIKWNKEAGEKGIRYRVFCASLADVFEDWKGPIVDSKGVVLMDGINYPDMTPGVHESRQITMQDVRKRLFELIDATPNLDWLLLTKRPENIKKMIPTTGCDGDCNKCFRDGAVCRKRSNIWLGTSVENQEYAEKRIPELLKCRELSPVLWLSCEPLLGQVRLTQLAEHHNHPSGDPVEGWTTFNNCLTGFRSHMGGGWTDKKFKIDWVIAGGESGPDARPSHPDWYRSLRDQCEAAGVPFHFKQWGEWVSVSEVAGNGPHHQFEDGATVRRVGVKQAGRTIDGVVHDAFPIAS